MLVQPTGSRHNPHKLDSYNLHNNCLWKAKVKTERNFWNSIIYNLSTDI